MNEEQVLALIKACRKAIYENGDPEKYWYHDVLDALDKASDIVEFNNNRK